MNNDLVNRLWLLKLALWESRRNYVSAMTMLFDRLSITEPENLFTCTGITPSECDGVPDTRRQLTAKEWSRIWWNVDELLYEYVSTLKVRHHFKNYR
jgi:hypothetical protein